MSQKPSDLFEGPESTLRKTFDAATSRNQLLAAAHMIDQARTKEDREQAEREFDQILGDIISGSKI